jgi:hypothetical protein
VEPGVAGWLIYSVFSQVFSFSFARAVLFLIFDFMHDIACCFSFARLGRNDGGLIHSLFVPLYPTFIDLIIHYN